MLKDPTEFRKRFAAWKDGKLPYDGGKIKEVVITPDEEYNLFLNTLPDNQRLTPEENYTTHRYWELNNKPKNFSQAILKGMYTMEPDGWHANSVQINPKGEYELMKPWNHSSINYEYDWYRSKDGEEFRKQYKHVPSFPNAKYVPRFKDGKLPGYEIGKPVKVGEYEVHPSAIDASELNVTTPEVVVTGTDRRPLYLRYDAPNSAYDPDAIRMFLDWAPTIGEIGAGIDFKEAVQNKDYTSAATIGAGFLLPPAVAKILRKPIKRIFKFGNRFFNTPKYTYHSQSGLSDGEITFAEKYAPRFSDSFVTPTDIEKAQFSLMYKHGMSKMEQINPFLTASLLDYIDAGFSRDEAIRLKDLFVRNPEYANYIKLHQNDPNINPFSLSTIDDFLQQQFSSLRGVHAKSKDDAITYLTYGEKGRKMSGGDRLNTNGGIYTSNSTNVADRFKNPETGIEDGYIGRLVYPHNIRKDLPIEEQLELYRKMVFPASDVHPLYGTDSYFRELEKAKNGGSIALEADYVGRASRGVPGQERAYLPIEENPHPILKIESLDYYPAQTNQAGRWGYGMNAGNTEGLFIPRLMNAYSDYVRAAKTFLSPKRVRDRNIYWDKYNEARSLWIDQSKKRDAMIRKIRGIKNDLKVLGTLTIPGVSLGVIGLGVYNKVKEDNEFINSPEWKEFLNDPNTEKYANLDDGNFFHASSLERLERKYKRKYHLRIKQNAE